MSVASIPGITNRGRAHDPRVSGFCLPKPRRRCQRKMFEGEPYAEAYAPKQAEEIWDRYFLVSGW